MNTANRLVFFPSKTKNKNKKLGFNENYDFAEKLHEDFYSKEIEGKTIDFINKLKETNIGNGNTEVDTHRINYFLTLI